MNKFYLSSGSENVSDEDNEDNLPYPEALPRSDFLAADFDAPTYLATLSDRHQTLEDLQSDLRERSHALSKELLDLVNANYEQFLSLGADLKGGEERLEDVKMGLLGFKRSVTDVRDTVAAKKAEVQGLLDEKVDVSRQIVLARKLLEFNARLEELEDSLMIDSTGLTISRTADGMWSDSENEGDSDDESSTVGANVGKLHRLVVNFRSMEELMKNIGAGHPFIIEQQSRISRIKNTIVLDLTTALKQTQSTEKGKTKLLQILRTYSDLGAAEDAIRILKDLKST
ncbi:hypothetical protein K3495_g2854 [Podosphaera aphanis]|nr:hypothetical protein K3495_g2854 [Podosphaera aphanis]